MDDKQWKKQRRLSLLGSNKIPLEERIDNLTGNILSVDERLDNLRTLFMDFKYITDTKLEMLDSMKDLQKNDLKGLKKKYKDLRDIWDKTVLDIIKKGNHG